MPTFVADYRAVMPHTITPMKRRSRLPKLSQAEKDQKKGDRSCLKEETITSK